MRDTKTSYGGITRFLHWLLLVLIVVQFLLALSFGLFAKDNTSFHTVLMLHESNGVLIFVLGLLFIIWRWLNPKPSLDAHPAWQQVLAHLVHVVIYIAVIAQPVFGVMLVMTSGHPVPFFGLFHIPQFVPTSKAGGSVFGWLHLVIGWWILLVVLALHLAASLYHHFVVKDNVLRRMLRGSE